MKVAIEDRRCKGYGYCADMAPGVYALDPAGFNDLVGQPAREVPPDQRASARSGAHACPMHALSTLEAEDDEPRRGDGRAPVGTQS